MKRSALRRALCLAAGLLLVAPLTALFLWDMREPLDEPPDGSADWRRTTWGEEIEA